MTTYLILKLIFIVINLIWFFSLNSNFSARYTEYRGNLWSLLFFPTYFILFTVFSSLTYFFLIFIGFISFKVGFTCCIIGVILTCLLFKFFNKLRNAIFNWDQNTLQESKNCFLIMVLIGLGVEIMNNVFLFLMTQHVWNSVLNGLSDFLWFISLFVDGLDSYVAFPADRIQSQLMTYQGWICLIYFLIFYAGYNKLSKLNNLIYEGKNFETPPPIPASSLVTQSSGYNSDFSSQTTFQISQTQPLSISTVDNTKKLLELKQLYDDGILSEEEFTSMKRDILKEGI